VVKIDPFDPSADPKPLADARRRFGSISATDDAEANSSSQSSVEVSAEVLPTLREYLNSLSKDLNVLLELGPLAQQYHI